MCGLIWILLYWVTCTSFKRLKKLCCCCYVVFLWRPFKWWQSFLWSQFWNYVYTSYIIRNHSGWKLQPGSIRGIRAVAIPSPGQGLKSPEVFPHRVSPKTGLSHAKFKYRRRPMGTPAIITQRDAVIRHTCPEWKVHTYKEQRTAEEGKLVFSRKELLRSYVGSGCTKAAQNIRNGHGTRGTKNHEKMSAPSAAARRFQWQVTTRTFRVDNSGAPSWKRISGRRPKVTRDQEAHTHIHTYTVQRPMGNYRKDFTFPTDFYTAIIFIW